MKRSIYNQRQEFLSWMTTAVLFKLLMHSIGKQMERVEPYVRIVEIICDNVFNYVVYSSIERDTFQRLFLVQFPTFCQYKRYFTQKKVLQFHA